MLSLPQGSRCAVSFAVDWFAGDSPDDRQTYLASAASQIEANQGRLQVFVDPDLLEKADIAPFLRNLSDRGHAVDLLVTCTETPEEGAAEALQAALTSGIEVFAQTGLPQPEGLRLSPMRRLGIQKHEDLQKVIMGCGLGFVSSDHSTKQPPDPQDVGFADKNAAMLIKHSQPRPYPSGMLEIPCPGYCDRNFFEVQGRPVDEWLAHVRGCVDFAHDMGGLMYAPWLDLTVLAQNDPEGETLLTMLNHAAGRHEGEVVTLTYRQAAESSVF